MSEQQPRGLKQMKISKIKRDTNAVVDGVGVYGGNRHKGPIGEIVYANCTLPDAELQLVGDSLKTKWFADQYLSNITLSLNAVNISQATLIGNTTTSSIVTHYNPQSIVFDGSGDYLTLNRNVFPYTNPSWTFEMWVNFTDFTAARGIAAMSDLMQIEITNSTLIYFRWRSGSVPGTVNGWFDFNIPVSLLTNEWYHLAVSVDNFNMKFFVNGIKKYEEIINIGSPGGQQTSLLYIGANDVYPYSGSMNTFMKGYIEDIRITSGVARYTSNFVPPQGRI